jgi:predicted metal-binding membrane protein
VLERLLARDRVIVLAGVIGLAALAWLDLWRRVSGMGRGMGMEAALPHPVPWSLAELGAAALMWGVMMIAMMLPSAAPMLLLLSSVQRKHRAQEGAATPTGLFASGYLLVWLAWSGLAAGLQWSLQALLLLSPHLATTSVVLGGGFLLLAGGYQLTPWKDACLVQCQSPFGFLLTRWREGAWGALRMGLHHGAYCLGCCWALMVLLFIGGVMNLLWVAALAGFILLEKAVARGPWLSRLAGLGLIGWGVYVLQTGFSS